MPPRSATKTRFAFEQTGDRIGARYAGGSIVEGHLVGTLDGKQWDVRYVQLTTDGETATAPCSRTVASGSRTSGRESKAGSGASVLEEVDE